MLRHAQNNRLMSIDDRPGLEKQLSQRSYFASRALREQMSDEQTTLLQNIKQSPRSGGGGGTGSSFLDGFLTAYDEHPPQSEPVSSELSEFNRQSREQDRNYEQPCTSRMVNDDFSNRERGMVDKRSASSNSIYNEQANKRPCLVNVKMERLDIDSPRYTNENVYSNQEENNNQQGSDAGLDDNEPHGSDMDGAENDDESQISPNVRNFILMRVYEIAEGKAKMDSYLYSLVLDNYAAINGLIDDENVHEKFVEAFANFTECCAEDEEDDDDESFGDSSAGQESSQVQSEEQGALVGNVRIKSEPV
jgi:hypothetical protein